MFDWKDYIGVASILHSNGTDEAAYRSAVSRAYYAAYNSARLKAQEFGIEIEANRDGESHWKLWDAFEKAAERIPKAVAVHGKGLKETRVTADYRNWREVSKRDAGDAVVKANLILSQLSKITAFTIEKA